MEGFKFDQAPKENSENNEEAISRKKAEEENLKKERLNLIRTQVAILFNTLNGLFRDLKNTEHVFDVAYLSTVPNRMLAAIPPAVNPGSFMNLALDLRNEFQALQFDIVEIPERDTRDFFIKELKILSRNLLMVSDASQFLQEELTETLRSFDEFNSNNISLKSPETNVDFDRDGLNMAIVVSRAIGESATRRQIEVNEIQDRFIDSI